MIVFIFSVHCFSGIEILDFFMRYKRFIRDWTFNLGLIKSTRPTPIRAAQYLRMSTDLQKYSIQNQQEAILEYASLRGIEVVKTYLDEGRSGVTLKGRYGLQQLLADVKSEERAFSKILVYDVSRWGRFPDTDESAHYEYLCKAAGVSVE